MSTTRNTDAVANQMPGGGSGEFHPRIERDEPLTTSGHQPGQMFGNDAVPEFSAQTLPPGTAPASRTFQPNSEPDVPPTDGPTASASDTLAGADSAQVHAGLGHPGAGQSSAEMQHDGEPHRKNPGRGLEGVGASGVEAFKTVDPHDPQFKHLRALDKDQAEVGRGNVGGPAAEERLPESAETVATENKLGRN